MAYWLNNSVSTVSIPSISNTSNINCKPNSVTINSTSTFNNIIANNLAIIQQNLDSAIQNLMYKAREIHFTDDSDQTRIRLANGEFITVKGDGSVDHSYRGKLRFNDIPLKIEDGSQLLFSNGSVICVDKQGNITRENLVNCTEKFVDVQGNTTLYEYLAFSLFHQIAIPNDKLMSDCELTLPDGAKVIFTRDGDLKVVDPSGIAVYKTKVDHKPPPREFNKYLNSSDLLEEFIKYCSLQRISKDEFYDLPITIFIYWLIVRAAQADKEDYTDTQKLLTTAVKKKVMYTHKCKCCGRFLNRQKQLHSIFFCSTQHMEKYITNHDVK